MEHIRRNSFGSFIDFGTTFNDMQFEVIDIYN